MAERSQNQPQTFPMTGIFQYLQRKSIWRSQRVGTGIATRILMGFLVLYFGVIFLVLGLFYNEMMDEFITDEKVAGNPINLLHKYLFYYLIFELVMRIIFQEVSEVKYRQLCLMPIRKGSIIHHILRGTTLSIFNLLPLFFIIPVTINTLIPEYGVTAGICWAISVIALLLFNNFVALQIKHWIASNPLLYIVPAGLAGLIYVVDSQGWLPISKPFDLSLMAVLDYLFPALIFIAITWLAYRITHNRMLSQAYISSDFKPKAGFLEQLTFSGLGERGFFGMVIQLNLQLIFRNKRIRTQVVMGLFFLLFGGFIFTSDTWGVGFHFYFLLAITGMIALNLAQFIWSYQAGYIELLWTIPVSAKKYINAQYNFLILACVFTTVPSMLYYFIDPDLPKMALAAFIFNIGVNIPVLLIASTYNRKKTEISTSGTFNMQGMGGMQMMFQFLVLVGPLLIFYPFVLWGYKDLGLLIVSGIGIIGILLKPLVIKGIASLLQEKKYSLTEGYRTN